MERADALLARILAAGAKAAATPSVIPIDVKAVPASAPAAIPFIIPGVAGPAPVAPAGIFGKLKTKPKKPKAKPNAAAPSLAALLTEDEPKAEKISDEARRRGVQNSFELDRILVIPRRDLNLEHYAIDLTETYRKPGGTMKLWPVQSAMLIEAANANGLLGPVSAGSGKTLASLLIGAAMGAKKIVLLVPPQLRSQLMSVDIPALDRHWVLPLDRLRVVAYSELSNHRSADILDQIKPDVIIADECFPYATKVVTDIGSIPIGDVVERGKGTCVLSRAANGSLVWKTIVRRLKKPATKRHVLITHTLGFLECTEDHKLWTEESGYAPASHACEGKTLQVLRNTVRRRSQLDAGTRTQRHEGAGERREEDARLESSRVESVTYIEGTDTDGFACRFVYDLEVEDTHNYIADGVVVSNCHSLKSRAAARTKRFNRYFKEHPECRFVGLSGTITRKSLKDYQHLSELALKKNSPLPESFHTLNEWAEALDVGDDPMPPGALLQLCSPEERVIAENPRARYETAARRDAHEAVRSGFRRRLIETPGVVATSESAVGTSLVINALKPTVPAEVKVALDDLRKNWEIAGDELTDILEVSRIARQLAAGIFTRWDWPGGVVDTEWLSARSAWHKEVRDVLKQSRRGLDSPLLVTNAVIAGKYNSKAYWHWAEVKTKYNPEPPRENVWVSDFLVKYAVEWAREHGTKTTPAIVWYQHVALGEAIAKAGNLPFFGAGAKASEELTKVNTSKTSCIVASIKAHSVGKNLQAFNKSLVTTCISSGADMEQLIARQHRPGQLADEVTVDVCVHTSELVDAFQSCLRDASYIEQSQGQRQKLNFARLLGFGNAV